MAEGEAQLPELPEDIILDILSRLPLNSIRRFRCVSRDWNSSVCDFSFNALRRSRYSCNLFFFPVKCSLTGSAIAPWFMENVGGEVTISEVPRMRDYLSDGFVIEACCDGLMLINHRSLDDSMMMYVLNPITDERIMLPECSRRKHEESRGWELNEMFGFGFDPTTNKGYKLVRLAYHKDQDIGAVLDVEMYTLGSKSWRKIGTIPDIFPYGQPVFANGALHWMAHPPTPSPSPRGVYSSDFEFILSIDLRRDECQLRKGPEISVGPCHTKDWYLVSLGDALSFVVNFLDSSHSTNICIWILKDEAQNIWCKQFSFATDSPSEHITAFDVLGLQRDGALLGILEVTVVKMYEELLRLVLLPQEKMGLAFYNPNNNRITRINIPGPVNYKYKYGFVLMFGGSLLSPKSFWQS